MYADMCEKMSLAVGRDASGSTVFSRLRSTASISCRSAAAPFAVATRRMSFFFKSRAVSVPSWFRSSQAKRSRSSS